MNTSTNPASRGANTDSGEGTVIPAIDEKGVGNRAPANAEKPGDTGDARDIGTAGVSTDADDDDNDAVMSEQDMQEPPR